MSYSRVAAEEHLILLLQISISNTDPLFLFTVALFSIVRPDHIFRDTNHAAYIHVIMTFMPVRLTESLPQSCMALLMIITEMSCQRTERSVKRSQGCLGLMSLIWACSSRSSSSSLFWTSQPRKRLRADQDKNKNTFFSICRCFVML